MIDGSEKMTLMVPKESAIDMGRYWGAVVTRQVLVELAVADIPEGKVAVVKRGADGVTEDRPKVPVKCSWCVNLNLMHGRCSIGKAPLHCQNFRSDKVSYRPVEDDGWPPLKIIHGTYREWICDICRRNRKTYALDNSMRVCTQCLKERYEEVRD